MAEWVQPGRSATGGRPVPSDESDTENLSVDELILRYLDHCDAYYRDADGRPTKEPEDVRLSLRPLSLLYGPTDAREFGARPFKLVREEMVRAGLSRRVVNQRAGRVKRLSRWSAAEELVPAAAYRAVQAVESLKPGRPAAPDRPVDPAHVAAALPHMTRPVAAMVRVRLMCGCRPGEVVQMRGADLGTAGDVWTFRPHTHEGRCRGRPWVIYLGSQCQQVLTPFVRPEDPGRFLFSPAEAMAKLRQR